MYLKALYLKNFRNYEEASVFFSPKINTIFGDNAQGKTNLLEAISLVMTGRSFRTHHLSDLIAFKKESFYIEAHFEKNGVDQCIKIHFNALGRKIYHNHTPIPTLSSLLGIVNGVILSPEDWELVKGGPSARRHFLDLQISKTSPLYLHHMTRYYRAMKQRNAMLKGKKKETIEIWEEEMARSAAYLTYSRKEAVKEIEQFSAHPLFDPLELHYKSSALHACPTIDLDTLRNYFVKQFASHRRREFEIGTTLVGPHKDDLEIFVGEKHARFFGSEGQQRCCVASLRFAEWLRIKTINEEMPMLCIDDVGVSLDQKRETALYRYLEKMDTQIFLTSPRLPAYAQNTHLIQVSEGNFLK